MASSRRWAVVALALIGAGLIAAPAIFGMFDRAPLGATMIAEFEPYMTTERLNAYDRDLADIDAGVREADTRIGEALHPGDRARFDQRFAEFAAFRDEWGPIHADMLDVLTRIRANVGNYQAVAALPSFAAFPWFFVVPGVLVLLAAGVALLRPATWPALRWALAALGIGLVLAPAVFQMFSRAPKGGRMMTAFETIETRKKVETIQGYFATIAVGQGSVRLDLIPALRRTGLTGAEIADRYPAATALDERWPEILGDLTPMIGTMSDNVDNYQAVAALPPFQLFPWFFVAPGLLVAALAWAAGRRTGAPARASARSRPRPERAA